MQKILMSLACVAILAGCGGNSTGAEKNVLAGKNFVSVQDNTKITLNFDAKEQRLHGKVVNNFNAPYELSGDNIIVGRMASTMMMPIGNSAEVERSFLDFMNGGEPKHFKLDGGTLTLTDHSQRSYKFDRVN